jgi:predicted nuclease of restriction endonuclease-like (RecB) superfamily
VSSASLPNIWHAYNRIGAASAGANCSACDNSTNAIAIGGFRYRRWPNYPGRTTGSFSTVRAAPMNASFICGQIEANLYAHCKHTQDCASSLSTAKTTALFDLSDDAYLLEFLDLPTDPLVNEIRSRLLHQLRNFFSAQGVNFCFVGAEYPLPLVGRDATIDLLFLHRGLNCLLAIEFQLDSRPENMLQMHLEYLAALDRENPTIGVLLCADKNGETVDYSLERSLSPAQVANYHKYLPTRKALQTQLHELYLRYVAVTGSND